MSTSSPARFGSPGGVSSSALLLGRQLKQMQSDKDIPGISCGLVNNSVFEWEVMLMLPDESGGLYGGGCFRTLLHFPAEYPHLPPKMKFVTPIWHPNSEFFLGPLSFFFSFLSHSLPSFFFSSNNSPPSFFVSSNNPPPSCSLRKRRSLHLHPTSPRRRQVRLRIRC
jgi:hypothetical protein